MDPIVFLSALLIVVGVPAATVLTIARMRAARPQALPPDASARIDALEQGILDVQQELAETQERLDFAERLLSKGRDEPHLGS